MRKVLLRLHYLLSMRQIEKMIRERSVFVYHTNVHRWTIKMVPVLAIRWTSCKITIYKSGANTAAIESVKADACVDILMRKYKYLNNIVEQDH